MKTSIFMSQAEVVIHFDCFGMMYLIFHPALLQTHERNMFEKQIAESFTAHKAMPPLLWIKEDECIIWQMLAVKQCSITRKSSWCIAISSFHSEQKLPQMMNISDDPRRYTLISINEHTIKILHLPILKMIRRAKALRWLFYAVNRIRNFGNEDHFTFF
jgi:hypothetical protein